ncbi:MAG: septum formation initiator family protein [Proteobacteria bacterium]|nr:septum formation initiator family protein [Pseudomonadota bacterium]
MGFSKKGFLKISLFTFLFLALIALWLGFGERGFFHLYQMEKERQAHIERIQGLEQKNRELLEEINRLREDKAYVESLGRRELGLIKEGEVLYRFMRENDPPQAPKKERGKAP